MVLNSVTNNIYGGYGAGPVATEVAKNKPEPKYNKYLRREPKIPFEQETTSKVVIEEEEKEDPVETFDDEKVEEPVITEETKVEDPVEGEEKTTGDTQKDEKVEE